jgi:hypothetical protein
MNIAVAIAGHEFTAAKGGYAAAAALRTPAMPELSASPVLSAGYLQSWRPRRTQPVLVDHELPAHPVSEYSRS